jgi:hypothetical protein
LARGGDAPRRKNDPFSIENDPPTSRGDRLPNENDPMRFEKRPVSSGNAQRNLVKRSFATRNVRAIKWADPLRIENDPVKRMIDRWLTRGDPPRAGIDSLPREHDRVP